MRFWRWPLASLLIHGLFFWVFQWWPAENSMPVHRPIEIAIIEKQTQPSPFRSQRQVVRDAPVPEELKVNESEDPQVFLSKTQQRVRKQQRAAVSGLTKNRSPESNSNSQKESQNQESGKKRKTALADKGSELFELANKNSTWSHLPKQEDRGLSTIGEALPKDVSVGSFTALNTNKYLYYSFYARIEELIRFRWESRVREVIQSIPSNRVMAQPRSTWITHLEVLLKPNGELQSAQLMKESGLNGFDQAAIQAFRQARMFPNPPKEMVGEDGLIRIKYAFQVYFNPRSVVESEF